MAPEACTVAALLAAVWGGLAAFIAWQRHEDAVDTLVAARRLALASQESIARRTDVIDSTLRLLRSVRERGYAEAVVTALAQAGADGPLFQIAFIGPDGRLLSSNLEPVTSRLDLSDREHFRIHADNPGRDELFVSLPLIGRASGKPSIQFSRRVGDAEGGFGGVMVASLDPRLLTELHAGMGDTRGTLSLYGTDGRLRARSPAGEAGLPPALEQRLAEAARRGDAGDLLPLPGETAPAIGAYARVPGRPLSVAVTFDRADAIARSAARRRLETGGALAVSLLVILGGIALGARRLRLARSHRDAANSREALRAAVEGISQGIVKFDPAGRVVLANRRAAEILCLPPAALAARPRLVDLIAAQHRRGEFGEEHPDFDRMLTIAPEEWTDISRLHVYERTRADGTVIEVRTHPLPDGGAVRTYTDVTERRAAEERARHFALHDPLTGLPNRLLLAQRLDAATRQGQPCAVLFLDLDRFKPVNDLFGHQTGDMLLRAVASRLRPELRPGDMLARLGGDEFAVMLPEAGEAAATALADRIVALVSAPFEIEGLVHGIGVSLGIALHPRHGLSGTQLLRAADAAMYRAKRAGKGTWVVYEDSMGEAAAEQLTLEQDVRDALRNREFFLAYQPVCDAASTRVLGFEALIRWRHARRGAVPPSVFIPAAERAGLIVAIGDWVLEAACAEAAGWPAPIRVAVNFSPPQFLLPDLCDRVRAVLRRTGLDASRLDVEVTEGLALADADIVLQNMRGLREMGVRISLDDFGTGNSSLSYLCRFPFDKLKIDRSFVLNLGDDDGSRAIVSSVLSLGRSLRMTVVAEGVETSLQLQALQCDQIQGYLLGRPLTPDQARALLAQQATLAAAA
ncbi:EAL domain-containing protein [Paracraurococcus ruber]|uniref:EAL domain-containing protein n=1 Tax=Paracraurococcus ruber TaxID=77675 RepID=UPI001A924D27